MVEQGYNYLDGSIQSMAEFFETRIEILERFDCKNDSNKVLKIKSNKRRKHSNQNVSDVKSSQRTERGKKFCQYHSTCGNIVKKCTFTKTLVKQAKLNKSK